MENKEMKDVKELENEELEEVSGGTRKETMELVALYNQYNPDRPMEGYSAAVWHWMIATLGYDVNSYQQKPNIQISNKSFIRNTYTMPDEGTLNHTEFMALLTKKAKERYGS